MAWRERDLPASFVPFLAKPPRSLRPIYPSEAFAPSAPLREPHYSRDAFFSPSRKDRKDLYTLRNLRALRAFARELLLLARILLAKPQRSQRPAYPCEAFAFSARLREKKTSCERYYFLAGVFSRQASKIAKPYIPLRSLCVLRAFAREKKHHASDIISLRESFLAKPLRSQRPIYPRGIFASFAPLREDKLQIINDPTYVTILQPSTVKIYE